MSKLLRLLLVCTLFSTPRAPAELIFYKGTDKVNYLGADQNRTLTWNVFLVIDHDTANVGQVLYLNIRDVKHYSTSTITNLHFVQVATSANGVTHTALSRPIDQCQTDQGSTVEGVFMQGRNHLLPIGTNKTTLSLPQMLTGGGHNYSPSSSRIVNVTRVVSFDKADTLKSNNSGETLDEGMARIVAYVQKLGYTSTSPSLLKSGGFAPEDFEPGIEPAIPARAGDFDMLR